MATRLLDTNIVSYLFKGHVLAATYRHFLAGHTLAICFMTEAELFEGAFRARWGAQRLARLEVLLATFPVHSIERRPKPPLGSGARGATGAADWHGGWVDCRRGSGPRLRLGDAQPV